MENGKRSNPVVYGVNTDERIGKGMLFAERRPIVAIVVYNLPGIRDWGSVKKFWTDVWDVATGQRLLRISAEKDVMGRIFSPDGRSFLRFREKKLEMYAVPEAPAKNK